MRIVFVTNKRFPNPRGSSGGLENLCEELKKRGHTVFVLASMRGRDAQSEEEIVRFKVSECSGKRWVWNPMRVRRELNRLHADVVHTQQYDGLGRIARKWAIAHHVPWVQTVSDLVSVVKSRKVKEMPSSIVVPAIAISRLLEREGMPYQKITVIPTGVVSKKIEKGNGDLVREEWHIPKEARVLLSVSRLMEEKNTEFLFRALLPLLRVRCDVYLLCVGGGNLLDEMRDAIIAEGLQERVLFADEVPQEKMKHYYAAGNIFVYVSKEDFRATVVAEAMYAGLPVVAVRSGGARERVMDKVTGYLVAEQEDAFLGAVERLLKDSEKARSLGQGGRLSIETHAMNEKIAGVLLKVYESIMP